MTSILEEKDFFWLCSHLTTTPMPLPFIETIFLTKDEVTLWVFPTGTGSLQKRNFTEEAVSFVQDAIGYFKAKRERETTGVGPVCVANVKGVRMIVDDDKVEEIISSYGTLGRSGYLQAPTDRLDFSSLYVVSLEAKDDQFISNFFIRKKTLHPAHNSRLFYKLLVFSKMLISALEVGKRKKVAALEIEFTVNDREDIWISGCGACKLISIHPVKSANPSPKPVKGTEATKPKREMKALASVRVCTPLQLLRDSDSDLVPEAAKPAQSLPAADPSRGGLPMGGMGAMATRAMKTPPVRGPFYNQNFREIIAKAYAKTRKRVALDIEEIFGDMDASFLKDDEVTTTKMRHSGSGLFPPRKDDFAPPLFEINGDNAHRSEDHTRATTPLVFLPPSATTSAAELRPAATVRSTTKRIRTTAKSMGAGSLQKIIDKYRVEKRMEYLNTKFVNSDRAQSMPRQEARRTYYFKKVSQ